jgi:hypothetical protein
MTGSRPQLGQVLVGQLAAPGERYAERLELLPRTARAHPEHQPAAAELVEVTRHARHQQRMPVRQHDHGRAKPHSGGDARQPGQRGEELEEPTRAVRRDRFLVRSSVR